MRYRPGKLIGLALAVLASAATLGAGGDDTRAPASGPPEAPTFLDNGQLARPADYREWVFVTSGLGMTYGPAKTDGEPRFDNVFVTRPAYRAFLESGAWPDRTLFVLEVRRGEAHVSINNGGRTQGKLVALEAAVKDRSRYPDGGWAYVSFDGPDGPLASAAPLAASASCYACHRDHGAVDHTFVQFYPTLLDAARRHGTIAPADGLQEPPR